MAISLRGGIDRAVRALVCGHRRRRAIYGCAEFRNSAVVVHRIAVRRFVGIRIAAVARQLGVSRPASREANAPGTRNLLAELLEPHCKRQTRYLIGPWTLSKMR